MLARSGIPRVTVLMAAYNAARYVAVAVDSILDQTYRDFELLIIDDGSKDDTACVLARYVHDPRVRVITLGKNEGLIHALNLGLSEARGEYLARMDADDICLPRRLERQAKYLDQHAEVGVVGSAATRIDGDGRHIERMICFSGEPDAVAERLTRGICPILHSSVMARTNLLRSLSGYRRDFPYAEDYDLWLRVSEVAAIRILPEQLICYRSSVGGIRFTTVTEAVISHAYALDCHQRRNVGQPELERMQFIRYFDPRSEVLSALWSLTLEALLIASLDVAASLNTEVLKRERTYRPARVMARLLVPGVGGVTSRLYRTYRRARGWLGSTRVGSILSDFKHLN